jgi:hypothetical protein
VSRFNDIFAERKEKECDALQEIKPRNRRLVDKSLTIKAESDERSR